MKRKIILILLSIVLMYSVFYSQKALQSEAASNLQTDNITTKNIFLEMKTNSTLKCELQDVKSSSKKLYSFENTPKLGKAELNAESGSFTYTAASTAGEEVLTYHVLENNSKSVIGTVTIKITEEKEQNIYCDLENHWAKDAAEYLTENSILCGEKVDGKLYFYPDTEMTRIQFIIWANSAFGFDGSENDNTLPFADTTTSPSWVKSAASSAWQNKMITGAESGDKLYFRAHEPLNRLEMINMLYSVLRPQKSNNNLKYFDKGAFPEGSLEIIMSMEKAGIFQGYDDNTLRIYNTVTRGEAAKAIYNTLLIMENKSKAIERLK